jgi:hypothetical protein
MEIEAFLADSVVSAEGKLYVQGAGWNVITAPGFPTRHPRIGIGVIVSVAYNETNTEHHLAVRLEDEDGQELPFSGQGGEETARARVGADFNVGRPANLPPGEEQIIAMAINLDGLVFQHPGRYQLVVAVDGDDLKKLGFRLTS